MSTTTPSSSPAPFRPSTSPAVIILLGLAVLFAAAAISFAATIYHWEQARIADVNANQPKWTPAPGMEEPPPEPQKEFNWGNYFGATMGGDQKLGPAFLWALVCFFVTGGAGLWLVLGQEKPDQEPGLRGKITGLLVGGGIGFLTVVMGVFYIKYWWDLLTGSRENWKTLQPWIPVGLVLAGLAIMFLCLLPLRAEERRNPVLRRVFYGYNFFLGCLLLLGVLAVANVITFFYFTHSYDWTATNIYTLSPQSRQILTTLDKPVKVYVFLGPQGVFRDLYTDMQALLTTSQQYTSKLEVEYVPPESDPERYQELIQRYEVILPEIGGRPVPWGVLVVYDELPKEKKPVGQDQKPAAPQRKAPSMFLGLEDIEKDMRSRMQGQFQGQNPNRQFQGEKALMSAITYLREGEMNFMLLFTKGNGEMELQENPGIAPPAGGSPTSLALLRRELQNQSGYECRSFTLGEVDAVTGKPRPIPTMVRLKTPAERSTEEDWVGTTEEERKLNKDKDKKFYRILAVVMADPAQVSPQQLQVLGDYLKTPDNRLIALLDVHRDRTGKIQRCGMEDWLRTNYGVSVGDDQVLQSLYRNPEIERKSREILQSPGTVIAQLSAAVDPSLRSAVGRGQFLFFSARSVRAIPGAAGQFQAADFLIAPGPGQWPESAALPNPQEFVDKLTPEQLEQKIQTAPRGVPLAATVKSAPPAAPGAPPGEEPKPKLVVFGDATFLSDQQLARNSGVNYNLFINTLSWLRGRGGSGPGVNIPPKTRSSYRLNVPLEQVPVWSPGLLILLCIVTAGIGVTLLRRR